jgi:signal transduction histidine kinase
MGVGALHHSKAGLLVVISACIVLAVTTVFAIELSDTQAKSKSGIEVQVHQRAVLAEALIGSLFQTVQQDVPQDSKTYGAATVSDETLNTQLGKQSGFLALVDRHGTVLASSSSFTAQARSGLPASGVLTLIHAGHPYALGNLTPYEKTGVIEIAVPFPTQYGTRILITGFTPGALSAFIAGELKQIPGVKGAHNYLIDGNDTVLATTNPGAAVGRVVPGSGAVQTLQQASGDVRGYYFDQVVVKNSHWRVLLVAPDAPLFASVTGFHQLLPWLIFVAFAFVALAALVLGYRVLRSSDQLQAVNTKIEKVNRDLTGANATLERRATELARSNEELDQFASIASHDLQEPLRKVRTFTEQLVVTEGDSLSEQGRDYLQRANAAAERMQKLVEDLLRFSRVTTQAHAFEPVDLSEAARQVVVDLEVQIEDTGAMVRIGALPTISADELQIRQLLQNLLSNALKFQGKGTTPQVAIDAVMGDDSVQLTVRDNGIGFDPRYSLRIFRVFERLNGRTEYPGTGIGLALCRKIVERHGGKIVAESEVDVGSTFTVTLPLDQREEVIVPPARSDADEMSLLEVEEVHA